MTGVRQRVLREIETAADEITTLAAELVRIPTVNPPGEEYRAAAELIAEYLHRGRMEVEFHQASEHPEHSAELPRLNVVGSLPGATAGPCVHFNGHFDVVPPGEGWTIDPFGGLIDGGRLYGRGSADMKAGLASALFAVEAIRRSGVERRGRLEVSGTVDEESGGHAGVAHLAQIGRIAADRTDHVIIPEPFGVDRICLGHRGVYWFRVTSNGVMAHGSMPFLGVNAIDRLQPFLEAVRTRLAPALSSRMTAVPVVPEGSRRASININAIEGGQAGATTQTPCVPDRCSATFDRRFLAEESFDEVKDEIVQLLAAIEPDADAFELDDLLLVEPTATAPDSPLVHSFEHAISEIVGQAAQLVASPGTYDHKHVARLAGIDSCIAYGPGELQQAHQVDESCAVEDIVTSTRVMAMAVLHLWERSD